MRIACVSLMGGLPWGGSEALWHSLSVHALDMGDQVFVSVYDWGKPHEKIIALQQKGAIVHFRNRYNPDAGIFERISRFIKNRQPQLDRDYQSIVDFKPDVVFISQGDSFDLAIHHKPLYLLLTQNNIPYSIVCHHHEQFGYIPPIEIYPGAVEVFKNAQYVFFVSHRQKQLTERRLICKIENAVITWNPLNVQLPKLPLAWPTGNITQMAIVANISQHKGHDTAFEVLSGPAWKDRKWVLNIYGEGHGMDYLKSLAEFYGLPDRINFHGHVNDIERVWEQNHLLLIPSTGEGLPISLVEAMACGRIAVATDVGGITELIIENENGFIAASATTESFSSALEKAWQFKNNWQQMGLQASAKINSSVEHSPQIKLYEMLKQAVVAFQHL